jgi:hypothetical protein
MRWNALVEREGTRKRKGYDAKNVHVRSAYGCRHDCSEQNMEQAKAALRNVNNICLCILKTAMQPAECAKKAAGVGSDDVAQRKVLWRTRTPGVQKTSFTKDVLRRYRDSGPCRLVSRAVSSAPNMCNESGRVTFWQFHRASQPRNFCSPGRAKITRTARDRIRSERSSLCTIQLLWLVAGGPLPAREVAKTPGCGPV